MILNGKPVQTGAFNTRILLYRRQIEQLPDGRMVPGAMVQPALVRYCQWTNAFGSEAITAMATGARNQATVLMRHEPEVDATWFLELDGNEYQLITDPDNIQAKNELMEFKVARVVPA